MQTNETTIDYNVVTYSNYLHFAGRKLAFKSKLLFDITGAPKLIPRSAQGWWIGRELLTVGKAKELIKHECVSVDISSLQWWQQVDLLSP
jgi:hypothetical protein